MVVLTILNLFILKKHTQKLTVLFLWIITQLIMQMHTNSDNKIPLAIPTHAKLDKPNLKHATALSVMMVPFFLIKVLWSKLS